MRESNYHPEPYWSEVAKRIDRRGDHNVIAGDDEPYYHYKRQEFLKLLREISFAGKSTLELGCGPGGNLNEIYSLRPARLVGVDISANMLRLAKKNIASDAIELIKVDGERLPFDDQTFDVAFTATVLQHNTEEAMMQAILSELCRVTGQELILFEHIEKELHGDELCMGRPVVHYAEICARNGFELESVAFINIYVSYLACGAIRKLFNPATRQEGEPLTQTSIFLQRALLPLTSRLDKIFTVEKDLARLVFHRRR